MKTEIFIYRNVIKEVINTKIANQFESRIMKHEIKNKKKKRASYKQ